jgi:hypothetical protein
MVSDGWPGWIEFAAVGGRGWTEGKPRRKAASAYSGNASLKGTDCTVNMRNS